MHIRFLSIVHFISLYLFEREHEMLKVELSAEIPIFWPLDNSKVIINIH